MSVQFTILEKRKKKLHQKNKNIAFKYNTFSISQLKKYFLQYCCDEKKVINLMLNDTD